MRLFPSLLRGTDGKGNPARDDGFEPLHLLWEKGGLTLWHPGSAGKQEPWKVAFRLDKAAQVIRCGRVSLHGPLAVSMPLLPEPPCGHSPPARR